MIDDGEDAVFRALADATRRELLDRLFGRGGQSLAELASGLAMSRQSVAKHLSLLEDAGLVSTRWQGREKLHFLNPVPIAEIGARWIDKFSQAKARALGALRAALEEKDHEGTRIRLRRSDRRTKRKGVAGRHER